jgi:hypothetical protein
MSAWSDYAIPYTAAWCSKSAANVAGYFAEHGSLAINGGDPAIGRASITVAAQGLMSAFADMVEADGSRFAYHWTLTGTNTGPGGTGPDRRVLTSCYIGYNLT